MIHADAAAGMLDAHQMFRAEARLNRRHPFSALLPVAGVKAGLSSAGAGGGWHHGAPADGELAMLMHPRGEKILFR